MALSTKAFLASSSHPIPPKRIPQTGIANPFSLTYLPSAPKWNIAHEHTLASTPLKRQNCGIKHDSGDFSLKHAQKLKVCRHLLRELGENPVEGLKMIDAVQRLGIDYYFQDEIGTILHRQYVEFSAHDDCDHDLHEVALRFRLLRQQGYHVPADVFNCFKDKEGIFNKEVKEDINGLMGLFEASQLCIEGENTLVEAGDFSQQLLNELISHVDYNQAKVQLAKMDFNVVQSNHQKEIVRISKWWSDLGLAEELEFARDQPLKWYICSMACLTDPELSDQRIDLTKPISFIYIIDDIFDVHGTLEELTLFTEAINKWDFTGLEQLPEYMKICFNALNDITNEISNKIYQKHGWNPQDSLRKTWATLCNAFLVEAQWFASGHSPKSEEYLKNGVISSGVHVVLVHIFYLLGQHMNKETTDIIDSIPDIMSSTATILRLWDDLGSATDESQDGHDGSYIEYYMKEHQGSSVNEAREKVVNKISGAWKRLNKECLSPNPFPETFTKASLNLARLVPLLYSYDVNHSLPSLEAHMKSLFYESVSV
ncbi:hypothetical protein ACB098_05G189100 [Castanea mollissima]